LRKYHKDGFIQFEDHEERFKNEFYTIIRTMQIILVSPDNSGIFFIGVPKLDQKTRLSNLQNL
jgi:hypothetical protein